MGGGEQHRHGGGAGSTEHDRALGIGSVHHGADIVALQLEHRRLRTAVREPDPAHVEQDQARERRQAFEEAGPRGVIPHHVDVRPDAGGVGEVDRPVTDDLVGDRCSVRTLRVAGLRASTSGHHPVETPAIGHALELVLACVVEREA